MAADRLAVILGRDPETSLGFLLGCTVLSPLAGALYESNVAYTVAEPLPVGLEWIPYLALHGSLLVGVGGLAGYHVAANRGYATTVAGVVVALYGVAFSVAPLDVGGGFPPTDATTVEQVAQATHLALAVGGVIAVIAAVGGLVVRRLAGVPEGHHLAALGAGATATLRLEATAGVVAVALLVVVSASSLAAIPPRGSDQLSCADPPSIPEVGARFDDGDLLLTYQHGCALPASSFLVSVDGERATWAERDPELGRDRRVARGRTLAVDLPSDAVVTLAYTRPGTDDATVLGYWNTSE